ncbi:MAG: clostripain-related cysteine peptidase [Candidatus Muirbacterium halophilum]|nr:clostripain-related cysteine peptidase [Candidatus Muirbacterium halophilum]MCK9475184.1 clostripain-related cysteine peptidase [Candidatus Muirbacterium halophilum]
MKKTLVLLSVFFLLATMTHAQKEWTIMVFLNGDNNLESAGIKDVNEMEKIGSTDNVDIIVQFDRAKGYDKSNGDWTNTKILHIQKDNDFNKITSPVVKELGEVDMGSYREAIRFFNWTVDNYPAKRYMFVYWNHGAGWLKENTQPEALVKGISYDDESGNHIDSVGMKQIAEGMYTKLGRKMDIVAFDACLMGMIEIAAQQSDYIKYMIASEETEPGDGWPYTPILKAVTSNPSISSSSFTKRIVEEYMASYKTTSSWYGPPAITQSSVDLSKTDAVVNAVDQLSAVLYQNMDTEGETVAHAMSNAQKYEYDFYKDLYNFCELLAAKTSNREVKAKSANVMRAVKSAVIMSKYQGTKMKDSHGIAIYAPQKNQYKSHYVKTEFAKNTGWDEMLNRYYKSNSYANSSDETVSEGSENSTVETVIGIIGALIDIFGKNMPEAEKYAEIDALAANAAKLITFNRAVGENQAYEKLIQAMEEHPELAVVLEKID